MINDLIKKLRKAADALDDLLAIHPFQNGYAAEQIGKRVVGKWKPANPKQEESRFKRETHFELNTKTGKMVKVNKDGTPSKRIGKRHWMKNPKNKAKMMKMIAKMHRARRAALKSQKV